MQIYEVRRAELGLWSSAIEGFSVSKINNNIIVRGRLVGWSWWMFKNPLVNRGIEILIDNHIVATTSTDSQGYFQATVDISWLSPGKHEVKAKFRGDDLYNPCESTPKIIEIKPALPIPIPTPAGVPSWLPLLGIGAIAAFVFLRKEKA